MCKIMSGLTIALQYFLAGLHFAIPEHVKEVRIIMHDLCLA